MERCRDKTRRPEDQRILNTQHPLFTIPKPFETLATLFWAPLCIGPLGGGSCLFECHPSFPGPLHSPQESSVCPPNTHMPLPPDPMLMGYTAFLKKVSPQTQCSWGYTAFLKKVSPQTQCSWGRTAFPKKVSPQTQCSWGIQLSPRKCKGALLAEQFHRLLRSEAATFSDWDDKEAPPTPLLGAGPKFPVQDLRGDTEQIGNLDFTS